MHESVFVCTAAVMMAMDDVNIVDAPIPDHSAWRQ